MLARYILLLSSADVVSIFLTFIPHTHAYSHRHSISIVKMSVTYNVKELFSGVLNKCGAKIKSWNRRWFVLKSDYCLYYYKDPAKGHLGAISIRDPKFKVRKGSLSDTTWPKGVTMECTIAVVTTHRTYFMYSTMESEINDWMRVLNTTRDRLLEEANASNRLLSGSRSYSETAVSNSNGSCEHSEPRLSQSIPPVLTEDEPYEAVYDSPEADLSQSGSCNGSPNFDTKSGERHASTTDSIYDLASGEEDKHDGETADSNQPLYAEAVEPDEPDKQVKEVLDETSLLYDDVETTHDTSHAPLKRRTDSDERDKPVVMYEAIDIDSPHTPSAKHLPLPAIPVGKNASSADRCQPIYEDIPEATGGQPLYDSVSPEDAVTHDRYVWEAERSDDDEGNRSVPSLPPKDDIPPLPPKDNLPQLPPKEGQSTPSQTPKEEIKVPPLPPKEDKSLINDALVTRAHPPPPLPLKEDCSCQPLASPKYSPPVRTTSPSIAQQVNSSSLSPSGQKKPTPKERTLTPPPTKRPSPVPRKRASPTPGGAAEGSLPVLNHTSDTSGQVSTVEGSSPGYSHDTSRTTQFLNCTPGSGTSSTARPVGASIQVLPYVVPSKESLPSGKLV